MYTDVSEKPAACSGSSLKSRSHENLKIFFRNLCIQVENNIVYKDPNLYTHHHEYLKTEERRNLEELIHKSMDKTVSHL